MKSIIEAIARSVAGGRPTAPLEFRAPAAGGILRRAFAPEIRAVDEARRTITFVASTEAVDRYGDIIRVAGWKLDNYKRNPVFLFGHKSSEPPIGRTVSVWTESSPKPALVHKVEFADADTYPFADTIYRLYRGGFLRAVSVGFMPLARPTPITNEAGNMTGFEYTNQELLELSAVPVPANPEAVSRCAVADWDARRIFLATDASGADVLAVNEVLAGLVRR